MKPTHEYMRIQRAVDFANAELKEPMDVLRIKLSSELSESEVLDSEGELANPADLLRMARRAQRQLQGWLRRMAEGGAVAQLAAEIADAVNRTKIVVKVESRGGKTVLLIGPATWGLASLEPITRWAAYQIINSGLCDAVAICLLDEWTRQKKRGPFTTPGCGKFILNLPGTKPRQFCCEQHANMYRTQVSRGRVDRRRK